jgi:hypothetical protein
LLGVGRQRRQHGSGARRQPELAVAAGQFAGTRVEPYAADRELPIRGHPELAPELPGTFPELSQDLHSAGGEICRTWRASRQSTRAVIRAVIKEGRMNRTSIVAAVAMTAIASISSGPTAFAEDETNQRFGTVHFATSCNETAQRRFDRGMRYQHSFWYQASSEIFEDVLKADPGCGIAYWGIALSLLYNPHAPPPAPNLPLGLAAVQKGTAVGAGTHRERA